MDKLSVVISCPIDTYSGYGARARDIVKSFLSLEKYDVRILSQRWGNTRFGYLKDHNEHEIASLIIPKLTQKPDVWIQLTIPNEFQPVGKYNIGMTAGIETTICDPSWIEGCNRMNLIIASSNHAKETFQRSIFDVENNGQSAGQIRLQKPVEVLFEGVDIEKYFKTAVKNSSDMSKTLDAIEESFCYLFVGHWLQGAFNEDRKNVGMLIKVFLETFKNKKNAPALILKTQSANASILDRDGILKKIEEIRKTVRGILPNIYLLHGEASDNEINELYNHSKVKAMVSLTKGEGFGRPLLEFSAVSKPIVASNWSGHLDFLASDFNYLVKGSITPVHESAIVEKMIIKESEWFTVDPNDAANALRIVYQDYKKYAELAKRQSYKTRTQFSIEQMKDLLGSILDRNLPEFPKQVELKLPTLQLPKLQKVDKPLELPKLQKING